MKRTILILIALATVTAGLTAQSNGDVLSSVEPRNTASLQRLIDSAAAEGAESEFLLIDVRTEQEYAGGHIPTAINIDYRVIAEELDDTDRDTPIVVYCRSGSRSTRAHETLRRMGFSNVVNFGGIIHWEGEIE